MATYHNSGNVISRSGGRSATAAAAYRAAQRIEDRRTGLLFDYTRKGGVVHSEIMAPAGAQAWVSDRAELWNRVELAEHRKDSQLAREYELALPRELPPQERLDLLRSFIRDTCVSAGMVADIAVHDRRAADGKRQPHAHVLLTMRRLDGDGFDKRKAREWNPSFQNRRGERGFVADTSPLVEFRARWADYSNQALERAGRAERIDHRSLDDQRVAALALAASPIRPLPERQASAATAKALDREPGIHLGPVAAQMERMGEHTERGDELRAIQERNRQRVALREEYADVCAALGMEQSPDAVTAAGRENDESVGVSRPAVPADNGGMEDRLSAEALSPQTSGREQSPGEELLKQRYVELCRSQGIEPDPETLARLGPADPAIADRGDPVRKMTRENREMEAEPPQPYDSRLLNTEIDRLQHLDATKLADEQKRLAEETLKNQEAKKRSADQARAEEAAIHNAGDRYSKALAQCYDPMNPYSSLARAALAEHGQFVRDQEALRQKAAAEHDPRARGLIELQIKIERKEHLAQANRRIARINEAITGKADTETRRKAETLSGEAAELRKTFRAQADARELSSIYASKAAMSPQGRSIQSNTEQQKERVAEQREGELTTSPKHTAEARRETVSRQLDRQEQSPSERQHERPIGNKTPAERQAAMAERLLRQRDEQALGQNAARGSSDREQERKPAASQERAESRDTGRRIGDKTPAERQAAMAERLHKQKDGQAHRQNAGQDRKPPVSSERTESGKTEKRLGDKTPAERQAAMAERLHKQKDNTARHRSFQRGHHLG